MSGRKSFRKMILVDGLQLMLNIFCDILITDQKLTLQKSFTHLHFFGLLVRVNFVS